MSTLRLKTLGIIVGVLAGPAFSQCTFTLAPVNTAFPASGGLGTALLTVTANPPDTSCPWTAAAPGAAWITFNFAPADGKGSKLIEYTVAPNYGPARTGVVQVAGRAFQITQATNLQQFSDVPPSSPFFNYISLLVGNGITAGCATNPPRYCPTDQLNRAQMAVFVVAAYNLATGSPLTYSTTPYFQDVTPDGEWALYFPYIQRLKELGITNGCSVSPPLYCPASGIPHEQMAVFMIGTWRLVNNVPSNFPYTATPYFSDVSSGSPYFKFIQKMRDLGFWTGCGNGQYCPASVVTREQASQLVMCSILNAAPPPLTTTISSSPPGLTITVDGVSCSAPCGYSWTPGTQHTLEAQAQVSSASWYGFSSWGDGVGSQTRTEAVPFKSSYQANFALNSGALPAITGPSSLHSNLSHLNFTYYGHAFLAQNVGYSLSCPPLSTVRQCFQTILGELRSQRVSGIRIFVPVCGDGAQDGAFNCTSSPTPPSWQSRTWNPGNNAVQQTWINNATTFFLDLQAAGIQNVALTFVHSDFPTFERPKTDPAVQPPGFPATQHCGNTPDTILFNATAPFGFKPADKYPLGQADNEAYNCAARNPYFIGWKNQFDMINALLAAARGRVNVSELEMEQEMNLRDFTAYMRFIYDNSNLESALPEPDPEVISGGFVDIVKKLRNLMVANNFDASNVAWSAAEAPSSSLTQNCTNIYTDYARQGKLDAIANAIGGGLVGLAPDESGIDGLWCGGTVVFGMKASPKSNTQPRVVDLHTYPHVVGKASSSSEVQSIAKMTFDNLNHFFALVPISSPVVLVGETHRVTQYRYRPDCTWFPVPDDAATQTAAGYNLSLLAGRTVVFRPWMELGDPTGWCYPRGSEPPPAIPLFQRVNFGLAGPYSPTNW